MEREIEGKHIHTHTEEKGGREEKGGERRHRERREEF